MIIVIVIVIMLIHVSCPCRFNQASRVINGIAEGQTIHLTVDRMQGRYRSVRVDWSCGSQSQNDLNPWNGQLVFAEVCRRV